MILGGAILMLMLNSCINMQAELAKIEQEKAWERHENEQIALAMGERKLAYPKDRVMRAVITAMSNNNMAVVNVDKQVGFIVSEGPGLFKNLEEALRICKQAVERYKAKYGLGGHCEATDDFQIRITSTIYDMEKGKASLLKIGISSKNAHKVSGIEEGTYMASYDTLPPEYSRAIYNFFWSELDKALFIQENTK